jgi:hypothetical protein
MPDGILVDESLCSVQIVGEVDGVRADQQPIDPARDLQQRRVNSKGLRRLGRTTVLGADTQRMRLNTTRPKTTGYPPKSYKQLPQHFSHNV